MSTKRYELAYITDARQNRTAVLYTIDHVPASEIPAGAVALNVINSRTANTIIFRSESQALEGIGQILDASKYSVVRTGTYMTIERFIGASITMESAFGVRVKTVNETLYTFAGACNFINHTTQPGVFYKWTKVSTESSVTVTSVGTFVVMDEFPVRSIYALCSDRGPNPTVSGITKVDHDEYIKMLVGATITNAALKNM